MAKRQSAGGGPITSDCASPRAVSRNTVAVVLALLVVSVYWPVGGHGFVDIDDHFYVEGNPVVLRGLTADGVSWAFTTFHASNWHPLTWVSHMIDVALFGPSPGWHHRMNVLFHLLNTEFLFFVLWRMTGGLWQSAFVAALFGVHPLHVESVAWVAERKDVLSTLFWVLTMGAYLRYVRRPGTGRYVLVMATFALGLLSKPMLVTLPFVLLLLDWWPLGRLAPSEDEADPSCRSPVSALPGLVHEKVPLLLMSAVSCVVTYLAQTRTGAVAPYDSLPFDSRVANALVSYATYLWKTVLPSSLAVVYPHPGTVHAGIPAWEVAGAILLACGLSLVAFSRGRRRPWLAVGWLWYVGTLLPVIGLVQVGAQARADRYTYVPLIGVFVAIAWGIPSVSSGMRFRKLALGAAAGLSLAAFAIAAWIQVGYWRDSFTLFSRALAVTDRNWLAFHNLGIHYFKSERFPQAADCFREALRIHPGFPAALNNLGMSCNALGQFGQAIGHFREALRINPDDADVWNNLGLSYGELGQTDLAMGCFREALRIRPDYAEARRNLAVAAGEPGRSP